MKFSIFVVEEVKKLMIKYDVKVLYPKSKYTDLDKRIKQVLKLTSFLDNQHVTFRRLSSRLWFLENNKHTIDKCIICNKEVNTFGSMMCAGKCLRTYFDQNETPENKKKRVEKAAKSRNYNEIIKKNWETRRNNPIKYDQYIINLKDSFRVIEENGKTVTQNRNIKQSETKNKIENNGKSFAKNYGHKISKTKKENYKPEYNHWNLIDEETRKKRILKQYKSTRNTNEASGYWRPIEDMEGYEIYFKAASFKHGFKTSNELEKKLLNENGVFHPANNPKGCVRDHLLSRRYGYENNTPAWIISHPANCEIVLQSENSSRAQRKEGDNLITLDELLERIKIYK